MKNINKNPIKKQRLDDQKTDKQAQAKTWESGIKNRG